MEYISEYAVVYLVFVIVIWFYDAFHMLVEVLQLTTHIFVDGRCGE